MRLKSMRWRGFGFLEYFWASNKVRGKRAIVPRIGKWEILTVIPEAKVSERAAIKLACEERLRLFTK